MPEDLPIACSLSPFELSQRLQQIAALGRDALVDSRVDGTGAQLRFAAAAAGVRERVDAIVAAESQCCAFLTMQVADETDAVVLRIHAPEGAEGILSALVDAFAGEPLAL